MTGFQTVGRAAALLAGAAGVLAAQAAQAAPPAARADQPCEVVITGVARGTDTTRIRAVTTGTGGRNTYVGGGVDATCAGQGNRLLADSAEHFTEQGLLILYHNVRYTEPRMAMTSDRMFYYTNQERLVADGNVRGTTSSGARFSGPQFEYFRAAPGIRVAPRWIAVGRPFVRMSPTDAGIARPDSAGAAEADSVDLTANRVVSENDSLIWASGNVVMERVDMRATGDSAMMDNGIEFARLMREPRIVGKGERPFTLDGTVIDIWSEERQLERVLSSGEAKATSDSLTLTGDTIDLRLAEQQIARVFVWGGRARADAPQQQIEADSMDILMPGQRLDEVRALGVARAWSRVDTARVITGERDWIAGDTITARFETRIDSVSTDERTAMREVIASGSARAFYQLPVAGVARGTPNLSYNRGRLITVRFTDGEMSTVTVSERASGLYLEQAVVDTSAVRTPPPGRRP
ncbi:MAG: hypothetical protein WD771_03905 [Gemmatimonadaceae bacterium]